MITDTLKNLISLFKTDGLFNNMKIIQGKLKRLFERQLIKMVRKSIGFFGKNRNGKTCKLGSLRLI